MKPIMKKTMLLVIMSLIALTNILINYQAQIVTVSAGTELEDYYEVDQVYSTYSPSTNYTIQGAMYSDRAGIAVRSISTTKVSAGLTLPIEQEILVTADTAIVLDAEFYSNLTRSMKIELVDENDAIIQMQNTSPIYLAKNGVVVSTLETANNSFSNCLNASSGYATLDPSTAYNQLVVPLTSFGYTIGETVTVEALNFYAPNWSTSLYNKYLLMSVDVTDDFSTEASFQTETLWQADTDNYVMYGSVDSNLDIQFLDAGKLLMEPSINGSQNAVLQQIVFKFPEALINSSGNVYTKDIAGLTIEYKNLTDTNFNGHFKLFSTSNSAIANSNYMNLKTHKITKDGTEANSNAKYFYPNTNTVGYADAFIGYNFNATDNVTTDSTESFYCADGDLPAEISPYFTFNYDNSTSLNIDGVYLGDVRIFTKALTVYENTVSSSENYSISALKGYLGNQVTFKAETNGRVADQVTLNGETLSQHQQDALFSETGLTLTMEGNNHIQIIFDDELPLPVSTGEVVKGTLELSNQQIVSGQSVRVLCVPNAGYALKTLKVNGVDVTDAVSDNIYITTVTEALVFTAEFVSVDQYQLELGAISSLYNSQPGIIWSEYDAVNVQTTYDFTDSPTQENIGVQLTGMNQEVRNDQYLVIELHNMINMWRTFYISINGVDHQVEGEYYLINRYQDIQAKTGMGVITESSSSANRTNATLSILKTEGFYGKVIIPISGYDGITSITDITIKTLVKNKSYARFNIGNVYVIDEFDPEAGYVTSTEVPVWTPSESNWTSIDESNTFSATTFLEKGDISLKPVVANSYGYDELYVSLPQNMINEDGYVDLESLGIKGIAIDVKNYNLLQHSMAIRIAGSDNTSLSDTSKTLWQTSISNHPASTIYPSGLVKSRNSAFIPYDDSGVFEGTIYIPFSSIAFTNIGAQGNFPTLIQPVIRILPGSMNDTGYSSYDFNLSNIRFITDESVFATHQITMTQIGASIQGDIDGVAISNNENNNVLNNSDVTFVVTPNNGYEVTSVIYQMGDQAETNVSLDNANSFAVNITGDILVQVMCDEIEYQITYILDGATNSVDNPENFTVESRTITLEPATKEGYRFLGWYVENDKVDQISQGTTKDITLQAMWEEITITNNFGIWFQSIDLWIKIATPIIVVGVATTMIILLKKEK